MENLRESLEKYITELYEELGDALAPTSYMSEEYYIKQHEKAWMLEYNVIPRLEEILKNNS